MHVVPVYYVYGSKTVHFTFDIFVQVLISLKAFW